jgi:ABC-type lipoprotein export system ATPase subunit
VAVSFVLSSVTYAYRRRDPPVLADLSVALPGGKTTAVVGASGTGKTTLLNLLGLLWEGTLAPGRITYACGDGAPLDYDGLSHEARARLRLREFGFVLQSCYLLPHFTCAQNIAMPLALHGYGRREREQRVAQLLAEADNAEKELSAVQGHLPGQVSGGQRQRMAVLRAVVHNPRVVFADEPVSNLDAENTEKMLDLLMRWRAGTLNGGGGAAERRTLVLVCHDTETAYRMADGFLILRRTRGVPSAEFLEKALVPGGADELRRLLTPKAAFSPLAPLGRGVRGEGEIS